MASFVYSPGSVARYASLLRDNRDLRIDARAHVARSIEDAARVVADAARSVERARAMARDCATHARDFALRTATYPVEPGTVCIDCGVFDAEIGMLCTGCHAEWHECDSGNE